MTGLGYEKFELLTDVFPLCMRKISFHLMLKNQEFASQEQGILKGTWSRNLVAFILISCLILLLH